MLRALARVDLAAVEANCRVLVGALQPGTRLCAVVKADGYGHGAVPCAHAALAGGASMLAVATAAEAGGLRAGGIAGVPVLVMGALTREELPVALAAGAEVVAWSEEFVAALARAAPPGTRVHLKHDSGMGRLGTRDVDELLRVAAAVAAAPNLELTAAMTHFATADEPDDPFFEEQLGRFGEVIARLRASHPGLPAHAANSAAALRDRRSHFDMVRCGIAVYGMDPFHEDSSRHGLRPALELTSCLAAVKPCGPGESAGYGRRFIADRQTLIGTAPIGYGDGYRRGLHPGAEVLIAGARQPLAGTVSMDNITIDLGPESTAGPGEEVVLIGEQGDERITAEELAARLGTINYEITCGISARVPRVHVRRR